jgi:hypothetical protein
MRSYKRSIGSGTSVSLCSYREFPPFRASTSTTSNISTVRPYGSLYSPRPETTRNHHPSPSAVCLTFSSHSVISSYLPSRCACTSFSSQALEAPHTDGPTTALHSSISLQASRSWSSSPCRRGGRDKTSSYFQVCAPEEHRLCFAFCRVHRSRISPGGLLAFYPASSGLALFVMFGCWTYLLAYMCRALNGRSKSPCDPGSDMVL